MAYQLDTDRFFFDPMARWIGAARYMGHKWVRDKEDILAEARANEALGWDVGAIRQLTENAGVEELLLLTLGLVLLGLEIFVIPGFGIAGVAGIACTVAAMVMALGPLSTSRRIAS